MPNVPSSYPSGPQSRKGQGLPLRTRQNYRSAPINRRAVRTKSPPQPTKYGLEEDVDELERSQDALLRRREALKESLNETSSVPGSGPPQRNSKHRSGERTERRTKLRPKQKLATLVVDEELPSYEGVKVPEIVDSDDEESVARTSHPRGSKRIDPPSTGRQVFKPPQNSATAGLKRPRKTAHASVSPKIPPTAGIISSASVETKLHEWKEDIGREAEAYAIEVLNVCNEEARTLSTQSHSTNATELVTRSTALISKVVRILELHATSNRVQGYGIEILGVLVAQDPGNSSQLLAHGGGHVLVAALHKASVDGDDTCFEAVLSTLRNVVETTGRKEKQLLLMKGLLRELLRLMQQCLTRAGHSRIVLSERHSLQLLEIVRALCYKNKSCVRPALNTDIAAVVASGLSRDINERSFERVGLGLDLLRSLSDGRQEDKLKVFFAVARYHSRSQIVCSMLLDTILRFQYCGDRNDLEHSVWVTERCLSTIEMLSRPSQDLPKPGDDAVCAHMVKKSFPEVVLAALKLHMQLVANLKPEARAATPSFVLLILNNLTRAQPRCIRALRAENLPTVIEQLDKLAVEYRFSVGPEQVKDRLLQRFRRGN